MTKFWRLAWGRKGGDVAPDPHGTVIHVSDETAPEDIDMALIEQVFTTQGKNSVARLLAERLRRISSLLADAPASAAFPQPYKDLNQVARMLDPSKDDFLKLEVRRKKTGKRVTTRINEAAITRAVEIETEARSTKARSLHGKRIKAVKAVAKSFGIDEATVWKALSSK